MHEMLHTPDQNIIGFTLQETLTEDDFHSVIPRLKDTMERYTTVRVLFELDGVDGWEPEDLWGDLAFDLRHTKDVDRIAVVSDDPWEPMVEKLRFLFPSATVEFYDAGETDDAWSWLRGEMEVPGIGPGSVPDPTAGAQDDA
jgi:hypothetical protein